MKKLFAFLCAIFILSGSFSVYASSPDVKGTSAILASLSSSQTVYSKNPDKELPPAELTKLMTAYATYKIYGTDTVIKVADDIKEYTNSMETNMNLKAGEEITSASLIYGMIMGQANDAAVAVALNYGGIEEFTERMNGFAKVLGMENTVFTNPTGSYDQSQHTTAADLLKLYREFYSSKQLYSFINQKNVTLPATNLSAERTYWTKNHLMSRFIYLDYVYDYANAGLSSVSSNGGYCVISSASKGTKDLVCIVLDSVYENGVNYSMIDAQNLFNYGFDKFSTVTIVKQGNLLYEAKLKNQKGKDTILLDAQSTLKGLILDNDDIESIEKTVSIEEPISAPLKKGDVVGKITYKYQGNLIGEVNLVAGKDVKRGIFRTIGSGIAWFFGLKAIKIILLLIVCAFAVIVVLIANTAKKNRRYRGRRRRRRY